jgi:hypothetical protein
MPVSIYINFEAQKFPLYSFEIGQMGTLVIPSLAVYYGG